MDLFNYIIDSLYPFQADIERMNLFGLGEPLLDPQIFFRIGYAKQNGFRNIAISTNGKSLNERRRHLLLESEIDTVIFSIDGAKKETHEKIRHGSHFEEIVENVEKVIQLRDKGDYSTRFVIRFIRQDLNYDEWEPFKSFWNARLTREKRDFVAMYDVHNNGGAEISKAELLDSGKIDESIEKKPCHIVFDLLIILADGSIALCHPDFHAPHFNFPKIPEVSPVEAFNSEEFQEIRKLHTNGQKAQIPLCNECTIPYSEENREMGWELAED